MADNLSDSPILSTTPEEIQPAHVLMFQRRLTRNIAGGARSVFDRSTLLQEMGHKVVFVIMDKTASHGNAIAALRKDGLLHPVSEIIFVQDLLETHGDRMRALASPPIAPDFGLESRGRDTMRGQSLVRREYFEGDILRGAIRFRDGNVILQQDIYDARGELAEAWIHDQHGVLLYIDTVNGNVNDKLKRRLVSRGRSVFCEIDLRQPLGLGLATTSETIDAPMSFAALIARKLAARYAHVPRMVLVADGENTSQSVLRAFPEGHLKGISVLHNNHTQAPYAKGSPVKPAWTSMLEDMRNVSRVICLTARQQDDLARLYPEMPLQKLNHPVFAPPKMGNARRAMRIVFVGRLAAQKRLDHLVKVFAHVNDAMPEVEFHVYGEGDRRQWLEELVDAAGLNHVVTVHGFTDRPLEAFASGALTVMTSYYEGLPLTILEAMSVGTPFVAYDLNYGPAEVITDGIDGKLVENGNPKALADAAVSLLRDPARLEAMSKAARDVAVTYTVEAHRTAWSELIEDALRDAGRRQTSKRMEPS